MKGTGKKKITPPRVKPGIYQRKHPKQYQFLKHKKPCLRCEMRRKLPTEQKRPYTLDMPSDISKHKPKVFMSIFAGRQVLLPI